MDTNAQILKQREIADEVLQRMNPIDPHAIIAGGAPRDWYFGRVAADLDVFFYEKSPVYGLEDVQAMLKSVRFDVEFVSPSVAFDKSCYQKNPDLLHVFNCKFRGQKIQFIRMKRVTFDSVVPTFPLNICMIWYKKGQIQETLDFKRAVKYKAIVKTNPAYANGDKYIQKIRAKFPNYKFYESYEKLAFNVLDSSLLKSKK